MKLYLASTSPRRQELLGTLGIPFEIIKPTFEEKPTTLSPQNECLYFAEQKALSVATSCPNSLVIGSDTLIDFNGKKLGKPQDAEDAVTMLTALSGKSHLVWTAVVLLNTQNNTMLKHIESASVVFKKISEKEIRDYVATGEPLDKAGAYAIQGLGNTLINRFEGSQDTIVGLSLNPLKTWLKY